MSNKITLCIGLVLALCVPARAAIINVPVGGDYQAAVLKAAPGDEIVLQAGADYPKGEWTYPAKPFGLPITVRSSAPSLPARPLTPDDAALVATISVNVTAAAADLTNAVGWVFDGIRFKGSANGEGEIVITQNSTNITFRRVIIAGSANGQKRGIRANGKNITVTWSHISNIWRIGQDAQAICTWDGPGPYTFTYNYLEASGENFMVGGGDPSSEANTPQDVTFKYNFVSKPLTWKGRGYTIKNLFELKNVKRLTASYNVFEHNWGGEGQPGFAVVISVRNQDNTAPYSSIQDVEFDHNIVQDTSGGFNFLGYDNEKPSGQATRINVHHTLIINTGDKAVLIGGEVGKLTLDHMTFVNSWTPLYFYEGQVWPAGEVQSRVATKAVQDFTYTNNVAYHHDYGVFGENSAFGYPTLLKHVGILTWDKVVLAGLVSSSGGTTANVVYPEGTMRVSEAEHAAQFTPDYLLTATSKYRGIGTGGSDIGWSGMGEAPPPPPPPPPPLDVCPPEQKVIYDRIRARTKLTLTWPSTKKIKTNITATQADVDLLAVFAHCGLAVAATTGR